MSPIPQKQKINQEIRYVQDQEIFADGEFTGLKRPKWQSASTEFQKRFLATVGRTYYADKNERTAVIAIEKSMLYLASGLISVYPTEWVENCMDWAVRKRREGYIINLKGLINLINDKDRRLQFIATWQRKNPGVRLQTKIDDMEENN
jgi:hypothetical protein